jgi:hypothetical protein
VHRVPQAPQFSGSEVVFVHELPHLSKSTLHEKSQVPPVHVAREFGGVGQRTAHPPQCSASVEVSMHERLQLVRPAGHPARQAFPLHTSVTAQALSQPPQLLGSLLSSMHVPPQSLRA